MDKIEVSLQDIQELKWLVERACNKQINSEYWEVLDILFEIRERLNKILVGE